MNEKIFKESPQIILEYLGYMQTVKGKSPKTIDEYYLDLRTFFRYILKTKNLVKKNIEFSEISISNIDIDLVKLVSLGDLYGYLNFVSSVRNNNASTRARKVASLKSFFYYLSSKVRLIRDNPAKELDVPKRKSSLPKFLTLEQSMKLLESVDGSFKERDFCILTLFLNCGMRLSELVNIDISDIRDDNTLKVTGKGNKERMVYLNEACLKALNNYLIAREEHIEKLKNNNKKILDKNALFLSNRRKRISPKTVQYLVYKYIAFIHLGGQGYSVHKLRHTAATLMYQYGNVDIRILKDILGHNNLGTTEIYTHLSNKQIKEAISSNPLADFEK